MSSAKQPGHQQYVPPKVWTYETSDGSKMTMNRPTAGARFEKALPVGKHPIQLYSMATPNGQKVAIMLEELLEAGKDADYDAWPIKIFDEDQFGDAFTNLNPNQKIPAMRIREQGKDPINLFESGSMMLQLAEKFDNAFLPQDSRPEVLNWLFWQIGSAPYLGGGFGHFFSYADEKQKYPIDRFTMETKRQLDVLERVLKQREYIAGFEYTIADIAIWAWYGNLVLGRLYDDSLTFLNVEEEYPHVIAWAKKINDRPAVQRGRLVNRTWGDKQLPERHGREDFDNLLE